MTQTNSSTASIHESTPDLARGCGPQLLPFVAVLLSWLTRGSYPWERGVNYLFFGVFFQNIGQHDRPRGREAPQSISFDETSRIKSVWARWMTESASFRSSSSKMKLSVARGVITHQILVPFQLGGFPQVQGGDYMF